jgi:uncharacterized membrane protein
MNHLHYESPRYFVFLICALLVLPWLTVGASYLAARQALLVIFCLLGCSVFVVAIRLRESRADWFFPVVLSCIAWSLLLSETVVSKYLSGWDIHDEFYLFLQVLRNSAWYPGIQDTYNSALSVTILPSVLAVVSSLDGFTIFTIIFPMLFSMVPMALYKIYRKLLPPEGAFLSVLVFLSYPGTYNELTALARQEIAEVLLVFLMMIFLSAKTARKRSGGAAIILLIIGIVIAHYSIAYVFMFLMAWYFLFARGFSRRAERSSALMTILLTIVAAMFWYLVSAGGTVVLTLTGFLTSVTRLVVADFLNPTSRPVIVQEALGYGPVQSSVLHLINRLTQYFVVFCIALGLLIFLHKKRTSLERQMLPFMTGSFALLMLAIFLPNFAAGLNFSRFYQIALLFVSPCFFYGGEKMVGAFGGTLEFLSRKRVRLPARAVALLLAALLFSYFLFTSGWVWAVSVDKPSSYVFDWQRMANSPDNSSQLQYFATFTVSQDVAAARWTESYVASPPDMCSDILSREHVLNSYGDRPRQGPLLPFAPPYGCDYAVDYVFLSNLNTVHNVGTEAPGNQLVEWPISEISPQLETMNRIYSGGSSVYLGTG